MSYVALWYPGFIKFQQECLSWSLDLRTTIHWNVVPAFFQHNHIYQGYWKNAGTTVQSLFSNPGDMVHKRWETAVQIFPLFEQESVPLSPGLKDKIAWKFWSGIFPTTLTYVVMLENCQNNISMYICFPIKGTRFKFKMEFYEAMISECNLYMSNIVCFLSFCWTNSFYRSALGYFGCS